jgi:hypothetical protein
MTKSKFDSLYRSKVHGSNNNFFYLDCKLPRPNNYERSCKHCITTQNGQLYPTNTSNAYLTTINKQIQNDVRVSSSEYAMNKASLSVSRRSRNFSLFPAGTWNQSSDKILPHESKRVVPSHGNSTRSSLTRARPGACAPGGKGVDVKHDSYARYLARLKGKALKSGPINKNVSPKAVVNNKIQKSSIIANCRLECNK